MDINDMRGLATLLCMVGFLSVVWWAYGPSRKSYFEDAADIPFKEDRSGEQDSE